MAPKQRKYRCDICKQRFAFKFLESQHRQTHVRKKYHCSVCRKRFRCLSNVYVHKCIHEKISLKRKASLSALLLGHLGDGSHTCANCGKQFKLKSLLLYHLKECNKTLHTEKLGKTTPDKNTKHVAKGRKYICSVCDRTFKRKTHLTQHSFVHARKSKCEFCNEAFKKKGTLISNRCICHLASQSSGHDTKAKNESSPFKTNKGTITEYECSICKKKWQNEWTLALHMLSHTDERNFVCEVCNKRFRRRSHLAEHKRIHTNEKPYVCDICDKHFERRSSLLFHQQFHEAPFDCDICGETMKNKNALIIHKKIHTSKSNYICKVCDKAFVSNGVLLQHMNLHTGKKPFVCNICRKTFGLLMSLRNHEKTHKNSRNILTKNLQTNPKKCKQNSNSDKKCKTDPSILHKTHESSGTSNIKSLNDKVQASKISKLPNRIRRGSQNGPKCEVCDICNEGFHNKLGLARHYMVHIGPNQYAQKLLEKVARSCSE